MDSERRNLEYSIDIYLSRVAVETLAFKSSQCVPASSAKALKAKLAYSRVSSADRV